MNIIIETKAIKFQTSSQCRSYYNSLLLSLRVFSKTSDTSIPAPHLVCWLSQCKYLLKLRVFFENFTSKHIWRNTVWLVNLSNEAVFTCLWKLLSLLNNILLVKKLYKRYIHSTHRQPCWRLLMYPWMLERPFSWSSSRYLRRNFRKLL